MDPAIIQEPNLPSHSSNQAIMVIEFLKLFLYLFFKIHVHCVDLKDKSIKYDASEKMRMDSLLNSYQEVLHKISHQENCLKRAKDEITLLKLDNSQSTKREEETQKQILQTKQEFRDYKKMVKENFEIVLKELNLENAKGDQAKTNSETENEAETDQVPISPLVNDVTPADAKENNKKAIPIFE